MNLKRKCFVDPDESDWAYSMCMEAYDNAQLFNKACNYIAIVMYINNK